MKSIFSNKTFRILLTALIILSALFCCGAMAEEVTIIDSGDCGAEGDNVTWVLDSAGTLTISGEGKMMDYTLSSKSPWLANDDVIQSILIKDGISVIGSYSFCFCSSVKSLTIPDSLTSIYSHAFYECISLQNIYCQSLMQWLNISIADYYANPMLYGSKLYINHELLTSAVIPSRIKYIRDYAFYNCNSLVSVVIPDGISSIGYTAFTNCSSRLRSSIISLE